jgi:hypothetical protein
LLFLRLRIRNSDEIKHYLLDFAIIFDVIFGFRKIADLINVGFKVRKVFLVLLNEEFNCIKSLGLGGKRIVSL